MLLTHRLASLACAALVAGCASTAPPPKPVTVAAWISAAEAAIKAGRNEEGVALLKSAAAAYPADKAPRLRIAQLQFDRQSYGEAITHAQEVLDRDPDDLVAHSLVAVSGLRVSSKALSDLAQKNNLTGSVRAEAQDLAKLLRANVGADIIVPLKPRPVIKAAAAKPAALKGASGDTPADWLKN